MEIVRVRLVSSEKTKACEKAPIEVVKALRKIKGSESGNEVHVDKLNLEEIHVDLDDLDGSHNLIFENSKEIFEKTQKSFFIGGDHSISYSIARALREIQENSLLIVFDAHVDYSGVEGKIDHKNWLGKLIECGFPGGRIILVGPRNLSLEDREFLKENKITLINMDVLQENISEVCDIVMERAKSSGGFYVSIDMHSVDPAFAPGVYEGEPGGLSSRELIYFIKRLSLLDSFRGGDIVEINPEKDFHGMTVKLGAKLLGEMI
jgi:arginase family enzyme